MGTMDWLAGHWQGIAAAWGAGLSTLLTILHIRQALRDKWHLCLDARGDQNEAVGRILNDGTRPVTIVAAHFVYADEWGGEQIVWSTDKSFHELLPEGRMVPLPVPRPELVRSAQQRVKQQRNCRLYFVVRTASKKSPSCRVIIDDSLVPPSYSGGSRSFVAADVFLGFAPLPEDPQPTLQSYK